MEGNCVGVNKLYVLLCLVHNSSEYSFQTASLTSLGTFKASLGKGGEKELLLCLTTSTYNSVQVKLLAVP